MTLRPAGPRVALTARTGFGDAAQEGLTCGFVEVELFCHSKLACEVWSVNVSRGRQLNARPVDLGEDAQDVGFVDDDQVFAVHLDFGAAVFGDEDLVASLHREERADVFAFVVFAVPGRALLDFLWLSLAVSGRKIPPAGFASLMERLRRTRRPSGVVR